MCCPKRKAGSPIPDRLDSFRAKLGRAEEHLNTLQRETIAFIDDPKAYSVTKTAHQKEGVYEFRLSIPKEPPMIRWALLIGDCIHNLRSALDHFFWQLVLIEHPGGKPKRHWKAGFPIYDDPGRFASRKAEIEYFVGAAAMTVLEGLQPFNSADPAHDALKFLNKQDVTDKHRLLVPHVGYLERGKLNVTQRRRPDRVDVRGTFQERLHDGAVIATVVVTPPESVVDMNFISLRLGIVFTPETQRAINAAGALADLLGTIAAVPHNFPDFIAAHGSNP